MSEKQHVGAALLCKSTHGDLFVSHSPLSHLLFNLLLQTPGHDDGEYLDDDDNQDDGDEDWQIFDGKGFETRQTALSEYL